MKTIEYLLWNNCNNNCSFCNMKSKYQSKEEDKLKAIELVKENIKQQKEPFNILLVGGEIFDNIDNKLKDNKLKDELIKLYIDIFCNNLINIIYINTNLLYNINTILFPLLKLMRDNDDIKRIHLTTSADKFGRFDKEKRKLFYKNLNLLRKKYTNLNIIVNTILTKPFCDSVFGDSYNIKEYCERYKVKVNIIPYINVNDIEMLNPTKEEAIKTLLTLKQQDPNWFDGYIDIMTKKDDIKLLQYNYKTNKLINITAEKNNCGHSINFTRCFKDDDKCFGCCLRELK